MQIAPAYAAATGNKSPQRAHKAYPRVSKDETPREQEGNRKGAVSTCSTRLLSQLQHADDTNFGAHPKESGEQRKDFQRLFSVHVSNNFICFVSFRFINFLVSVGEGTGREEA